jgi:hypothetical protein
MPTSTDITKAAEELAGAGGYDPDANITVRHGTANDGKTIATDIFDWLFERAPKAISRKTVQRETVRIEG